MKLVNLSLQNFRQHRQSSIRFADGLTGIIGSNGSGKSTLVEGIAFALYGSRALRGKIDEVRTLGILASAVTSAELVFEAEGVNYRVWRDLSKAELYIGGGSTAIVSGNKAVAERIEEILGLNLEEFLSSYYTEQKSLEFLSGKKGTTEREKFITRMIGYDRLEKIQTILRDQKRDLKSLVYALTASQTDLESLNQRINNEQQKLNVLRNEEAEASRVLRQAEVAAKLAQEEWKALETLHQQIVDLRQQVKIQQNLIDHHQQQLERLLEDSHKLKEALFLIIPEEISPEELQQQQLKLEAKIEDLSGQLSILKKTKEQLEASWKSEIIKKEQEVAVRKNHLELVSKKLQAIKKLKSGSACPTCGQLLGKEFAMVADSLELEKNNLQTALHESEQKFAELMQPKAEVTKIIHEVQEVESFLQESQERCRILVSCQGEVQRLLLNANSSKETERMIAQAKDQLTILQARIQQIDYSDDVYIRVKADVETRANLLSAARLQKVRNEGLLRESEAMLGRSQEELLDYKQKVAEIDSQKKQLLVLEESDQILSDFRKYLNSSIRPRLAELASNYLAELSDGRYSAVLIADDFSPIVMEDGNSKHILSGGEEDLLDLCLRLALSSLIAERAGQNLSFLILDEVFGSLDENRRTNVLVLLEKLQNRFEQILLITHLEDIKDGVTNLLQIDYDESTGNLQISSAGNEEIF